eukprot:scaffold123778_cov40-Attheya_sp.AAC.3
MHELTYIYGGTNTSNWESKYGYLALPVNTLLWGCESCRSHQTTRKLSHQKHQENSRHVHVECRSSKNYKQTNSRRIQQHDFNGKHNSNTTTTMDWKTCKITRIPTS